MNQPRLPAMSSIELELPHSMAPSPERDKHYEYMGGDTCDVASIRFLISSSACAVRLYYLGRPEQPFRTGLCFTRDVSFFLFFVSPLVFRAPSTDRPETLPHSLNLAEL